ncbi:PREDICTED: azurocidin-like [Ceratosolen solmsi marchali]|uniref:Azurocidin-like n=1 Tax=Ceratosolen solmsi marchali TaxID=326594 RepID=A0AAJ6YCC1_9HYME|nr:PREDICTED: azurocidin-like [Ceratosolen solmsi marchali]
MAFNIFLLLAVFTIICTQCNLPTVNAMIGPNVRVAHEREFPFIVAIKHINLENPMPIRDHICTAAMISKVHVLSAAQCTENRIIANTAILYGSNALIFAEEYRIRWWINFNQWTILKHRPLVNLDNDIVIIKLTREIEGDFQPAQLWPLPNNDITAQYVHLAGWGMTERRVLSLSLLTDSTVIITNNACEHHIRRETGRIFHIHERHFCSLGITFTLLQRGDFGGPVLYCNKIVGINKQVLPEARRELNNQKINIHTSIHFYREFIEDVNNDHFNWEG